MTTILAVELATKLTIVAFAVGLLLLLGLCVAISKWWCKAHQGQALIRTGSGTRVSFSGMMVYPIFHRLETMDISVKRIEIFRHGKDGLICKDNMRADIKVVFFVRVNKTKEDVLKVAQLLGCERASDQQALVELFDAKFSEGLKTVGKRFEFVKLYDSRNELKAEILDTIGTDLNGYVLDDAAIDYLEQTPLESLNPNNILDVEGIKKITDLTAKQQVLANDIAREKEKTIQRQDVEAREVILGLNKELAEAEEKQKREIAEIKAREEAAALIVQQEEVKRSESARIATEEEVQVAEENKLRQVIVAAKNKERTEAIETERIERDRMLEVTERERVVTLADIEKEKVVEAERRNIQEVIRERVTLERSVVEEQERIKDTEAFAEADRVKQVTLTKAEETAESLKVQAVTAAMAKKEAAETEAKQAVIEAEAQKEQTVIAALAKKEAAEAQAAQDIIEAEAEQSASEKQAQAKRVLAEAMVVELAAPGMAEAQVMEADAIALEKHGLAQAKVLEENATAEARGIESKAEAMKKLDGVGREHEEFKLQLEKDLQLEMKEVDVQKDIAVQSAVVLSEALKSANIDIVGGEAEFFDKIIGAVTRGEVIDRTVNRSEVLTDLKASLLNGTNGGLPAKIKSYVAEAGLGTKDIANLSVSALLLQLMREADPEKKGVLQKTLDLVSNLGIADVKVRDFQNS